MKRYQVIGIPISPPFSVLAGRKVGDTFDADLDEDIEKLLREGGALREVHVEQPKQKVRRASGRPTSDDKDSDAEE